VEDQGADALRLEHLGGLDRPDSGTISYAGQDLLALSDRKRCAFRNQTIGFIFQFHHLLQEFSALENVIVPGMIRGGRKTLLLDRARELLEAVGLGNRLHHRPTELSGGEQQRVAIARALALSPGVVLADEPTGNLDPATGKRIHELLLTLQAREGTTLIFVTHNRELVTPKTRLVRLERGGLVEA